MACKCTRFVACDECKQKWELTSPEKTAEYIKIMQAYLDGEEIEYRQSGCRDADWKACDPCWNFEHFIYRVKPKPREWKIAVNPHGFIISASCLPAKEIGLEIIKVREVIE